MLERIKEYIDSFKGDDIYLIPECIEDDLNLEFVNTGYEINNLSDYIYYSDDSKNWYKITLDYFIERAIVSKVVPKQITKTIWEEV